MSSTYSTNLALEMIGTGDQAGNWGATNNLNIGTLLEQAISGYTTQVMPGTDVTLTMSQGASATARNMSIELTGTGGASLIVPTNRKLYLIYNSTVNATTVKVSGLTGVSVPAGKKMFLVCNGTDVVAAVDYFASLSAGSLSLTTPLPVASGGTGSSTLASATASIGAVPAADLPTVGDFLVGVNTSLAVTGASGAAGTATITFATQTYAPFLLGQAITVAGMNPAGYNATANVTAVTTSSVSYENATTAAFVSGGTVSATVGNIPAGASVVANATTSNIWRARYNVLSGGAVTFTDIADAPYVGAVSIVVSNAAHVITNNANLVVQGGANYTCVSGDILIFTATTTSTFRVSIFKADGAPVLPAGTAGNLLVSNGTTWTSTAPSASGVTSVATGNGLSGGTITSTGTLTIAAPSLHSIGSYGWFYKSTNSRLFPGNTISGSYLFYVSAAGTNVNIPSIIQVSPEGNRINASSSFTTGSGNFTITYTNSGGTWMALTPSEVSSYDGCATNIYGGLYVKQS
jgi:hypothetical protein